MNTAVTVWAEVSVTAQFDVPLQTPFHPSNTVPDWVAGVRVTMVPCGNEAVQVPPEQFNPDGLLVTLPLPSPANVTLKEPEGGGLEEKFALTETEEVDRAITQEPVPVHAPPQPENVLPLLGVAVRVTLDPCGNVPEQVLVEQDMPVGLLVTVPPPLIEIDKTESVPVMVLLDTSKLGGLSFPDVSYAVTAK